MDKRFNSGFIKNNNYKLVSAKDGCAVMEAEIDETSLNPFMNAHGGYIYGLADTVAGAAAYSNGRPAVTLSGTMEYLHTIRGKKLRAEAICIKDGRNTSNYEVSIYDIERDRVAAKALFTYFYIEEK